MFYTFVFTIGIRSPSLVQKVKKEFTFSLTIPVSKCTLFIENYTNLCEFLQIRAHETDSIPAVVKAAAIAVKVITWKP